MSTATPSLPLAAHVGASRRSRAELGALARVEVRRLLRHPVLLAGIALSLAFLRDEGDGAALDAFLTGFALLPLAAATLVVANLAALRSRRDGTDELYAALPRPRSARVAGQLLALAATLPIACALVAIAFVVDSFDDYPRGLMGPLSVALAQGPVMVVAFGALGILLARLAPTPIVAPLAIVGLFAARAFMTSPDSWASWLLPMSGGTARSGPGVSCGPDAADGCLMFFNPLGTGWHLTYLGGLALLVGAGALVERGRPLRAAALCAAALAIGVATKLAAG